MVTATAMPTKPPTSASAWWSARFDTERVSFSAELWPALLQTCRQELPPRDVISEEELFVVLKFCIAEGVWQSDTIACQEFAHFVARFGPLDESVRKLAECLTVNRELVTWFHGTMSRTDAERELFPASSPSSRSSNQASDDSGQLQDGAFLVRFSESQPTRFTLSYLKIHPTGPRAGKREMRNVLIENVGKNGYVLSDSKNHTYPSIRSFVQRSASRLRQGIPSPLAKQCNLELAMVRTRQDHASNSYTTFSSEALEPSTSAATPNATTAPHQNQSHAQQSAQYSASMLFTKSPTLPPSGIHAFVRKYGGDLVDTRKDKQHTSNQDAPANQESAYSDFSVVNMMLPPRAPSGAEIRSPVARDNNYGAFSATSLVMQDGSTDHGMGSATKNQHDQGLNNAAANGDYGNFMALMHAEQYGANHPAVLIQSHATRFHARGGSNNNPATVAGETRVNDLNSDHSRRVQASVSSDEYTGFGALQTISSTSSTAYGNFAAMSLGMDSPLTNNVPEPTRMQQSVSEDGAYGSFLSFGDMAPDSGSVVTSAATGKMTSEKSTFAPSLSSSLATQSSIASSLPPSASQQLPVSDAYGSFVSATSAMFDWSTSSGALVPPPRSANPSIDALTNSLNASITSAPIPDATQLAPVSSVGVDKTTDTTYLSAMESSPLHELNAGMECYKQKRLDAALLHFIQARERAHASEDQVVEARALGNLGTVYLDKQNPEQAVVCYEQCLAITKSIRDVKRERTILNNLVLALMASEDFESAHRYCQIQLDRTVNEINRRKILSRMSLLRERAARASRLAMSSTSTTTFASSNSSS